MPPVALKKPLVLVLLIGGMLPASAYGRDHRHPRRGRPPAQATDPAAPTSPAEDQAPGPEVETLPVEPLAPVPPPADGRPSLTALLAAPGLSPQAESQVLSVFLETLGVDQRVHYRDAVDLLEPRERAEEAIAAADHTVQDSARAFEELDLSLAAARAEQAIAGYRRHLPTLATQQGGLRRLREAWTRLAAIRFLAGDHDAASNALRHAFVFGDEVQASALPPQMKRLLAERRAMFAALGLGRVAVDSSPAGAAVYVNGAVRGLTPLTLDDLPAGPNSLTVVRRGYLPGLVDVEIAGGAERSRVDVDLARYDDDPFAAAMRAKNSLGVPLMPEPLQRAAARLHVDLVIALVPESSDGIVALNGWLFDARSRTQVRHAVRSGAAGQLADTAAQLATELLHGLRGDGRSGARVARGGGRSRAFWPLVGTAIGVVAAGAAVGITLGVLAAEAPALSPAEQVILFGLSPPRR